jgi:hypothetical protein
MAQVSCLTLEGTGNIFPKLAMHDGQAYQSQVYIWPEIGGTTFCTAVKIGSGFGLRSGSGRNKCKQTRNADILRAEMGNCSSHSQTGV